MSQQTRTCARTPIGRHLRVGVRPRLNRTADLDGKVDAEPGLKIPGAVHHCPGRVGWAGLYRGDRIPGLVSL